MGITATGVGSGLDINSLVSQLMNAESAPLDLLKTKQSSFNAKLSAFGSLQSAISTFQTALKSVSGTALGALTATSGKPDIVGASATSGSGATPGSYAIEVSQLAQRDKFASGAVATGTTFAAAGSTMSITVAGKTTNVTFGDVSLAGLSSAINSAGAGVTATIVNDGTADHLVITGKDTGSANGVSIAATGSVAQFDTGTGAMTRSLTAQDAVLTIDGISVTKPSNTLTDAIKGITLNLAQTNVGSPVTVTVANDATSVKTAVTGFVDAYNALADKITKMTSYDAATKTGGVLNGDSSARSILSSLRAEMTKAVAGSGSLSTLSDIGISFQRDGRLLLEKPDKLQAALDSNFDNLGKLFSSTGGYATRLNTLTTNMLSSQGVITSRTDGLKATIKTLGDNQLALQDRLAETEKRYREQFNALDTMMAQMKSTSNFLTQQLSSLSTTQ